MKSSFILYHENKEIFDSLSDEHAGKLIKCIFEYDMTGEIPELEPLLKVVFIQIRQSLDRNRKKYEKVVERNRKNIGSRWSKDDTKNTTGKTGMPGDTKNTDNELDNDNDNEKNNTSNEVGEKPSFPEQCRMIQDLYNSVCESYPRLVKMSDARKKAIKARLNSGYTIDDFKLLFEKAEKSLFLKGKNNRNWSATFDWLIAAKGMERTLEGNYDEKRSGNTTKDNYEKNNIDYDALATEQIKTRLASRKGEVR